MASQKIIEKIARLLRLAQDQEDTPEGMTAAAHAKALMEKHGIDVELDPSLEPDTPLPPGWIDVASFPVRTQWLENLANATATLYGITFGWRQSVQGHAELGMHDPLGDTEHLAAAAVYFELLVRLVNYARPMTLMGLIGAYGTSGWVDDLYRRGISDAILTRIIRGPKLRPTDDPKPEPPPQRLSAVRSGMQIVTSVAADVRVVSSDRELSESTALVHVRSFRVPRNERIDVPPPPPPDIDPGPPIQDARLSPTSMVYSTGFSVGAQLPLPDAHRKPTCVEPTSTEVRRW